VAGRIQTVAVSFTAANQYSPWVKHDYYQDPFDVSLAVFFDTALEATLAVQYVLDDQSQTSQRPVTWSQTTTTITVTDYGPTTINGGPSNAGWGGPFGHGLLAGDMVQLAGTQAGIDGLYNVASVTNAHTYTLTTTVSQTSGGQGLVTSGRVLTHSTLTALSARASGQYSAPVWMSRLTSTALTAAGVGFLVSMQGR
jgi:hypothetical protein